jgi:hypothetical protein
MRTFLAVSMVLVSMALCSRCPCADQKADEEEIQVAKTWLAHLKSEATDLSEAILLMSHEVSFDGTILSEKDEIRKRLASIRQTLTTPAWIVSTTDFERLDGEQIEKLMRNSKHARKYAAIRDKIHCMVLFRLKVVLKGSGEENTDGVFLGFDSNKKVISWFD